MQHYHHSFTHYFLSVYHVLGAVLNFIIVLYLAQHLDTWYTFNKIFKSLLRHRYHPTHYIMLKSLSFLDIRRPSLYANILQGRKNWFIPSDFLPYRTSTIHAHNWTSVIHVSFMPWSFQKLLMILVPMNISSINACGKVSMCQAACWVSDIHSEHSSGVTML